MIGDERLLWLLNGRRPCLARTEVYSRVCGFFRPVQQWNKGKQEEYRERRLYQAVRFGKKSKSPTGTKKDETPDARRGGRRRGLRERKRSKPGVC